MSEKTIFFTVVGIWVASEVILGILKRAKGEAKRDKGSLATLWILIVVSIIIGENISRYQPTRIPNPELAFWMGIGMILAGIVIRGVAIATLWRHFTVNVAIGEKHELITHGIYRVLRHPAYTGSLLSFLGLGVAFGNWLSVAVIALAMITAFSYRIAVEERALIAHFGDRYGDYARRTKRLVPFIY